MGKNWQKDYTVWDMCCGVGNLEVKHSNPRNIYMSTLDSADIDVMKATKTCVGAVKFQYDFLNDDINDFGQIDYNLTNKIPQGLREAIANNKKILVLINPPYAEAANSQGNEGKTDVAKTNIGILMNNADYGYASRELFLQFIARIGIEIPNATIAMFSTLKYVNAPNFEKFREVWKARYIGGFVVHSKSFDGLKGNFPIGFLVWQTTQKNKSSITEIKVDVLDKNAKPIGEKSFYNLPNNTFLSEWIVRLKKNNEEVIPLINSVTPTTKTEHVRNTKWSDNAIAHFFCNGNDLQNSGTMTAIFSSVHSIGHAGGYFITPENLWQSVVVFTVKRIIKPTWLNDRDQFLQPTEPLSNEFKSDCLIWMLFNGSNLTASANDLEWNNKKWSIVNHFIPFTEDEVGAPDRFESDFMVQYLRNLPTFSTSLELTDNSDLSLRAKSRSNNKISPEAQAVMQEGRKLWQAYFAHTDVRNVRDELKLNRPDVGWYQVRKALQARNASSDYAPVSFKPFEEAYKALTEKLQPMVYELGFLKV
ncbi:MAG: hypothetical protein ACOYN4_19455 [Bacteroidales bacterium]